MKNTILILLTVIGLQAHSQTKTLTLVSMTPPDTLWKGDTITMTFAASGTWDTTHVLTLRLSTTIIESISFGTLQTRGMVWKWVFPYNNWTPGYYYHQITVYNIQKSFWLIQPSVTGIDQLVPGDIAIQEIKYFSIDGRQIPRSSGLSIERTIYTNGTTRTRKIFTP